MGIFVINYFEIKQKGCGRGFECGKINATIFLHWLMRTYYNPSFKVCCKSKYFNAVYYMRYIIKLTIR